MQSAPRKTSHTPSANMPRRAGAFTVLEMMIVVLIISISYAISIDLIATFEGNQRADRAAREMLSFFRFARHLAMTTGNNAKVQIDTQNRAFAVYLMSNGSTWDAAPYAVSMAPNGIMRITMPNERELAGTTVAVTPAAMTAFIYQPLGTCAATGTVTLTYATHVKTITVPAVGDPQIN